MLACIWALMGPAKHEEGSIFHRKMRGFRMFEAILERIARKKLGAHTAMKDTSGPSA